MNCNINMFWDDEACVWVATSEDLPGLVLEDESFEALVDEVKLAVPTLIYLNQIPCDYVALNFVTIRSERLALVG